MLSAFRKEVSPRAAFIPFVVAGYPTLKLSELAIDTLIEEGANLIELGVPFSDALADGPVIQFASEKAALKVSLDDVLALASRLQKKHPKIPLVLFTYYNPLLRAGIETFARKAKESGVSAVLVVDLPPEESESYRKTLGSVGLKTIFLASPTTAVDRLSLIDECSTGFMYYVSRAGVTGAQTSLSTSLKTEVDALRGKIKNTVGVGFGISTGAHAKDVAKIADAVIVGSAFVKLMGDGGTVEEGTNDSEIIQSVRKLAREISEGCTR